MEAPRSLTGEVTSAWKKEGSLEWSVLQREYISDGQQHMQRPRGKSGDADGRVGRVCCGVLYEAHPAQRRRRPRSQRVCVTATSQFTCPGASGAAPLLFQGDPKAPERQRPGPGDRG